MRIAPGPLSPLDAAKSTVVVGAATLTAVATILLLAGAAVAQTPSFEAASVKKNAGGGPPGMEIRVTPNGGFIATNVPLRTLVRESFRVQDYQLIDLPGWADGERFDIVARSGATTPDWQPMVQALL